MTDFALVNEAISTLLALDWVIGDVEDKDVEFTDFCWFLQMNANYHGLQFLGKPRFSLHDNTKYINHTVCL